MRFNGDGGLDPSWKLFSEIDQLCLGVRCGKIRIALSNRVLEKIHKEASKQKRSRSEHVELHFETLFFAKDLEN